MTGGRPSWHDPAEVCLQGLTQRPARQCRGSYVATSLNTSRDNKHVRMRAVMLANQLLQTAFKASLLSVWTMDTIPP